MLSFSAAAETMFARVRYRRMAVYAVAAGVLLTLPACDQGRFADQVQMAETGACPRPQSPTGRQPQFNQQQHDIRLLRERGFHGDFFAQLELGGRYEARRDADRNLLDTIEASVWYALALTNPQGYESISPRQDFVQREEIRGDVAASPYPPGVGTLYDDCRVFERRQASAALAGLWQRMSSEEQEEVRKRIVYVLSTQGASGYRILARITQTDTGPFGAPRQSLGPERHAWWDGHFFGRPRATDTPPAAGGSGFYPVELFARNDVDSYLYDYLAAQGGDVGAYVLMKDFESGSADRAGYADFVEAKANRWTPPYEFYPPDAPASGVPHSDEGGVSDEAGQIALSRIDELPFVHVLDALHYLRVVDAPPLVFEGAGPGRGGPERHGPERHGPDRHGPERLGPEALTPGQVQAFQAMLGREQTGHLTPLEKVRAIQYAAVDGSTHAQLVLAVMYSEGVGVKADYARAFHWYQEAARAGSPEAKFAIANYFSLGVGGVADQDKARAVIYRLDSALAGFQPQATNIQAVLAQVSRKAPY